VSDEVSDKESQVKRERRRSNTPGNDSSSNADSGAIDNRATDSADQIKKEYKRLMAKGIRLLSMREHSVREISKKLSLKCESLDLVYAVVDELIANKYLSDRRFTETFVRSRQNRGFGPNKIKLELSEKGIEINIVDDYLDMNSAIWYESAEQQYSRKYGDGPVDDYKTWAKRARFMQGRGFSMEHIQVVVPAPTYN
jgi:regulatory protein